MFSYVSVRSSHLLDLLLETNLGNIDWTLPQYITYFNTYVGGAFKDLSTDQGLFREESSSSTGDFNSGGPAAGRKKTDFEDDIGGFEVRLSPPSATEKLPSQAESPSSRNRDNPVAKR